MEYYLLCGAFSPLFCLSPFLEGCSTLLPTLLTCRFQSPFLPQLILFPFSHRKGKTEHWRLERMSAQRCSQVTSSEHDPHTQFFPSWEGWSVSGFFVLEETVPGNKKASSNHPKHSPRQWNVHVCQGMVVMPFQSICFPCGIFCRGMGDLVPVFLEGISRALPCLREHRLSVELRKSLGKSKTL